MYILKSNNSDFIYVGSTHDLKRRLAEHNEGSNVSTKSYRPFKLVAYVAAENVGRARNLDKYFKTGSGKAVLKKKILGNEALA